MNRGNLEKVANQDDLLVQYLLGELGEEAQEAVELGYIGDRDSYEQLLVAEDELIDAYVRGELSESQSQRFESHFLCSSDRRTRLAFAKAWLAYVSRQSEVAGVLPQPSDGQSVFAFLRVRAWPVALRVSAAAVLILAGAWLIVETVRLRNQVAATESQRAALETKQRELEEELNDERRRSLELSAQLEDEGNKRDQALVSQVTQGHAAAGIVSLLLTPGLVRGTSDAKRLILSPDVRQIILQAIFKGDNYKSYQAVIRTVVGREVWNKTDLKAQKRGNSQFIVLRLRANALSNDDYILTLSGVTPSGESEVIAEYPFSVSTK